MRNYLSVCVVMWCLEGVVAFAQPAAPTIVPFPQQVEWLKGEFRLDQRSIALQVAMPPDSSVSGALSEMEDLLRLKYGSTFVAGGSKIFAIGIAAEDSAFHARCQKYGILIDPVLGPEAYSLRVDGSSIILNANAPEGLFYGLQSFKQLVRGAGRSLNAVRILDFPAFRSRMIMDDVSRGPVPTVAFVKYQIRRLAELKVNMFMQYTEHVVRTVAHPEFAPTNGSYSIAELKELADYAARYHIQLVGNFQSFGHFQSILAAPPYAHLGESGTLLSPALAESYVLLDDIYREMIPAFRAPFFAVHCDEPFDLGSGASRHLVDSIGFDGAYAQHVLKICDLLKNRGQRMMIWGDVLLAYPGIIRRLPKDVVIGTWSYDALDSYDEFIRPFTEAGLNVFVAPGVLNSNRLFPGNTQAVDNIRGFAKAGQRFKADGMLTAVWDDGGLTFFANDWYPVSFAAEQSWHPNAFPLADFKERLIAGVYGSAGHPLFQGIDTLGSLGECASTDGLTDRVLFENLLPSPGDARKLAIGDWDRVAQIAHEAKKLFERRQLNRYDEDRRSALFTSRLYEVLAHKRMGLVYAAATYRQAERDAAGDPGRAQKLLVKVAAMMDSLEAEAEAVRSEFARLWLTENQPYALDSILSRFNRERTQLSEVSARVRASIRALDQSAALQPIADVGLAVEPLRGSYFAEWLMTNPIASDQDSTWSCVDFLQWMGGEAAAAPRVAQESRFDTSTYRWRRIVSSESDAVNVSSIFPAFQRPGVIYAYATIQSEQTADVSASVGCSGDVVIFCNGARILDIHSRKAFIADAYRCTLPLRAGVNRLLIKSAGSPGLWGFSLALHENSVRHRKNRYRIVGHQLSGKSYPIPGSPGPGGIHNESL